MLKIGVLGAGHLGKIHLNCIKQIEKYDLVGFFDPVEETARQVEAETGVRCFDSVASLIDAVDVVDIVTPTIRHFECASKALQKRKHVFIEKPIVATPDEANALKKLADEAGVKVQVGHVERFNPAFIAAEPFIGEPLFIEAHRLAQFNPRGTDVPVVLDLMVHDLDILLTIVKSPIAHISASGVSIVSPTPDITNVRIEFENGAVAAPVDEIHAQDPHLPKRRLHHRGFPRKEDRSLPHQRYCGRNQSAFDHPYLGRWTRKANYFRNA